METKDTKCRKWQLTINNPEDKGITHMTIQAALNALKSVVYWCMSDEIGEQKTPHTHVFLAADAPIRFSTIKKRLPEAHIEQVRGTCAENRAYVRKEGEKYADKAETSIPGSFEEWGELPEEPGQGARTDIAAVYNAIVEGKSNAEILAANPDYAIHINRMDKIRTDVLEEQYRNKFREITVTYIFGPTETGKTRSVMEKNGYSAVYRVTDYEHPFDRYDSSEEVLLFDEFRSSLKIAEMLIYTEGYPTLLPARYAQRVACYTEVYIVSNIDLKSQYPNIQTEEPATWRAFLRRIDKVLEFRKNGSPIDHGTATEYIFPSIPRWVQQAEQAEADGQEELPF